MKGPVDVWFPAESRTGQATGWPTADPDADGVPIVALASTADHPKSLFAIAVAALLPGVLGCGNVGTAAHPTGAAETVAPATPSAIGTRRPSDTEAGTIFTDVTARAGLRLPRRDDGADTIVQGAGVVAFDYNDDGYADLYVPNLGGANALYRNNGDGTFSDVAQAAGVDDRDARGNGGCAADYDNDGDQDLYVTNYGPSRLFRNSGDGAFSDATASANLGGAQEGLRSTGCAWGDYDRDGYPDLIVARHLYRYDLEMLQSGRFVRELGGLALYHNEGDGAFADLTSLLGDTPRPKESPSGLDDIVIGNIWGAGFQPGWVDYDNDGDLDLYVVNDFGRSIHPNVLWRNDGPAADGSWSFVDASIGSGADVEMYGMGLAVADYDLDGFFDLFVTNVRGNVLLRNDGNGLTFTDTAAEAGAAAATVGLDVRVSWGAVFFDYDNDGDEDLYVVSGFLADGSVPANPVEQPNLLFRNDGAGGFTDVSWMSGAEDPGVGRGVVYLDYDNDGCLDVFIANRLQGARLFRNRCTSGNNWLTVQTAGAVSNRDGLGARVTVEVGGRTQLREIAGGSGHMGQNMLPAHFGLGSADLVDKLTVRWPSGGTQTLTGVPVNRRLTVTERGAGGTGPTGSLTKPPR